MEGLIALALGIDEGFVGCLARCAQFSVVPARVRLQFLPTLPLSVDAFNFVRSTIASSNWAGCMSS